MTLPPGKVSQAVEDLTTRDPEWQELQRADGQGPSEGRVVYWDAVHGWIRMEGPKWTVGYRGKAKHLRPY